MNLPKEQFDPNKFLTPSGGDWLEKSLSFLAKEEGFKPKVYLDGSKVPTIGHGLTAKEYVSKGTISEMDSLAAMKKHIDKEVMPSLKPYFDKLNDNQKTALVSYVYNVGSGNFAKSSGLKKALKDSNWSEAAKQMDIGYNDKRNPGLKTRRDKERQLFLS
jgi:lysozyme